MKTENCIKLIDLIPILKYFYEIHFVFHSEIFCSMIFCLIEICFYDILFCEEILPKILFKKIFKNILSYNNYSQKVFFHFCSNLLINYNNNSLIYDSIFNNFNWNIFTNILKSIDENIFEYFIVLCNLIIKNNNFFNFKNFYKFLNIFISFIQEVSFQIQEYSLIFLFMLIQYNYSEIIQKLIDYKIYKLFFEYLENENHLIKELLNSILILMEFSSLNNYQDIFFEFQKSNLKLKNYSEDSEIMFLIEKLYSFPRI